MLNIPSRQLLEREYNTNYAMLIWKHDQISEQTGDKMTQLEDKVREAVGQVVDPETGMTFAEMNMIKSVKEEEPGVVKVEFIPSSPFCPIAFKLAQDIKKEVLKVAGIKKALVYCRGHMMEDKINEMTNKE